MSSVSEVQQEQDEDLPLYGVGLTAVGTVVVRAEDMQEGAYHVKHNLDVGDLRGPAINDAREVDYENETGEIDMDQTEGLNIAGNIYEFTVSAMDVKEIRAYDGEHVSAKVRDLSAGDLDNQPWMAFTEYLGEVREE